MNGSCRSRATIGWRKAGGCASTPRWSRPTFTMRPTAACWATRCGCCPAPTDSLEPIPSVDAEKRGDRKGEPDERQYDHCNSNDKRPEQIFPRSLRRRVDRVELPVLLIESFDNVIHRITSCTPAGRRIHPVSTEVSPPRKNMTAFVWARAPVLFLPIGIQHCGDITRRWSRGIRNRGRPNNNGREAHLDRGLRRTGDRRRAEDSRVPTHLGRSPQLSRRAGSGHDGLKAFRRGFRSTSTTRKATCCPPQCVPCRNLGDVVSNQPGSQ